MASTVFPSVQVLVSINKTTVNRKHTHWNAQAKLLLAFIEDPQRKQERAERRTKSSRPRLIEEVLGSEEVWNHLQERTTAAVTPCIGLKLHLLFVTKPYIHVPVFQEYEKRQRDADPLITAYAQISEIRTGQVFVRVDHRNLIGPML